MNQHIRLQIVNMRATVKNCQKTAHWAADKDDAVVSEQEVRILRALDRAVSRFIKDLDKINKRVDHG